MNKFGKIISLALSAAICAGSVSIPVLASDADEVVNADNAVSVAAKEDFSIEKYPYSYLKTFNGWEQIRDHIEYNESAKYNNALSTRTSNPGIDVVSAYQGDGVVVTFYSAHREDNYGGAEVEAKYGNAVQIYPVTKNEHVYSNPTTGGQVGLTLEEAVVGTNKVAFWTKAEKTDSYDRQEPEQISYSIDLRDCGASSIRVTIPADGQWHYVVADLTSPVSSAFSMINVSSNTQGVFGDKNEGRPPLKLDGREGVYPVDSLNRPIKDISEAYVLIDGEYVRVRASSYEFEPDPEGAYINIPNAEGENVYYRTNNIRYHQEIDETSKLVHIEDEAGNMTYDMKTGKYVTMTDPEVNFYDRYSVSNVEAYQIDEAGNQILDEEGNPIPATICGDTVKEIWQTQIYIDEMLFYRTTESGGRTTFLPSTEEDVAYYSNTELDSITIDGITSYDVDLDGDNRVLTLPKNLDLSNPDLSRFNVITKCPDVILKQNTSGDRCIPLDISETGPMRSGSVGTISLPANENGKAIVTVTSAYGTMQEYEFDVKWGYDLSVVGTKGNFDDISAGAKQFTLQNYGDEDKEVLVVAAVKDINTNELKTLAVGKSAVIPANGTQNVTVTPSLTGISRDEYKNHVIYFYFYDSVTAMNQVVSKMAIFPKNN